MSVSLAQPQDMISELIALLGPEKVQTAAECGMEFQENITEYRGRNILGTVSPHNRDELVRIIEIANRHRIPLYPFSSGKNWGLGSKLPVVDGALLVNLKNMNRIIEVNDKLCYAVIEPGVTQQQLYEYLESHQLPLMLNVTGSGARTSVVGNTLERGVGVLGQRTKDLRQLEIVLGTGEIVRTGFGHYFGDQPGLSFYSYGLGPDLMHLFTQSNFGIVSNITIDLAPKQNVTVVMIETPKRNIVDYINKLAELRRFDQLTDCIELTTQNDPRLLDFTTVQEFDPDAWLTWLKIYHREAEVPNRTKELLASELDGLARRILYFSDPNNIPEAVQFRSQIGRGSPTNYTLDTMARMFGIIMEKDELDIDIDRHKNIPGFVCLLPAVPFHGPAILDVVNLINDLSGRMDLNPVITFSAIGKYAFEGFARVYFNRNDPAEVKRAHQWNRETIAELEKIGIYPYRLNVDDMTSFTNRDDSFWHLIKRFKQACDPNGIIAPGRYCPL